LPKIYEEHVKLTIQFSKLILAGIFLLAPAFSFAIEERTMTEEQNKVLSTITKMGQAYNSRDIDAVMTTYETSASVLFEPGKPVVGATAVKEMFMGSLAISPQFSFGKHEVVVAGDIALHITPWTMTGKMPDGQKVEQKGLSVAVLRKQSDGKWLMVIDNPHGQALLQSQ